MAFPSINMAANEQQRIAVIGAGVAGITAAHLLQRNAAVKLLDKNDRLGGHTNTIVLEDCPDVGTGVDTGFIVLNNKTYPLFHKLLADLNCPVQNSEMSFGFSSEKSNFYYAGTGLSGLFAQPINIFKPGFYAFISEILKFGKKALADLKTENVGDKTLEEYTRHLNVRRSPGESGKPDLIQHYIIPMAAAIWSATQNDIMQFPAKTLLEFWKNHGLLSLKDRPQWQTVTGGSHSYLKAFRRTFCGQIMLNAKIKTVRRGENIATIVHDDGYEEEFDKIIIAAHADEALALLESPTPEEQELLGAWTYQENRTILHTDVSFMPAKRNAWASWNYIERKNVQPDTPVPVTYYMNRLQNIKTHDEYFVTLNPDREPADGKLIKDISYHHPVFSIDAVRTQTRLPSLNGKNNTWFCGSYFSNGFHEDAVRSGVKVADSIGEPF